MGECPVEGAMKATSGVWLCLLGLAALAPAALRSTVWPAYRPAAVDPVMAQSGETLFKHEWTAGDPLASGGDGLGPVFNANSCTACHYQGGVGGGGAVSENVTIFAFRTGDGKSQLREGVVHAQSTVPQL